jgi:hypothetical protein
MNYVDNLQIQDWNTKSGPLYCSQEANASFSEIFSQQAKSISEKLRKSSRARPSDRIVKAPPMEQLPMPTNLCVKQCSGDATIVFFCR